MDFVRYPSHSCCWVTLPIVRVFPSIAVRGQRLCALWSADILHHFRVPDHHPADTGATEDRKDRPQAVLYPPRYRILPAAYFYLIVVTIFFYTSLPYEYLIAAYTYLTSYAFHVPWVLRHLWSLSVEEQFYLAWPFAMTLGVFLAPRLACFAIVAAPLLRLAFIMISPSSTWPRSVTRSFPA